MRDERHVDPIEQQLWDELLARTWAAHEITHTATTDIADPVVLAQVSATSRQWSRILRDPTTDRSQALGQLARVLWPTVGAPGAADGWWQTPLGEALLQRLPEVRDTHAWRSDGPVASETPSPLMAITA